MGHSQSYDLRNKESDEKSHEPVRAVRRVSKEHETENQHSDYISTLNETDSREELLRDRIRAEKLRKQENELESLRVREHESREPIIDAYRQTSPVFTEFNHYDSLNHPQPIDQKTFFTLKPRNEVNFGKILPLASTEIPSDPSPGYTAPQPKRILKTSEEWPKQTPIFSGRLSPLPLQEEVNPHPMPRYIPPMSESRYDVPIGTYSKTTTVTTYTTYGPRHPSSSSLVLPKSPSTVPQYDQVPLEREPKQPTVETTVPLERELKHPTVRTTVPQYSEVPEEREPKQLTVETTVPLERGPKHPTVRTTVPQYYEVPQERELQHPTVQSTVPHYDQVPQEPIPQPRKPEPKPEKYTVTLPVSTNTTYSRRNSHPHYDTVPTVPTVPPSVGYGTYKAPKYDEVPVVVVPRRHTIVIPIVAGRLDYLDRAEEIPEVPLKNTVTYSIPATYNPPVSPRVRVVPVATFEPPRSPALSNRTHEHLNSPYRTPSEPSLLRSTVSPRSRHSTVSRRTSEVSRTSWEHLTFTSVTYRTPSESSLPQSTVSHHTPIPSKVVQRAPSATVAYRTRNHNRIVRRPSSAVVFHRSSTPSSLSRTPLPTTHRTSDVSLIPLDLELSSTVTHRSPTPSTLSRSSYRTPTPTVDQPKVIPPSKHYSTPLQSEVRATPLLRHVAQRDTVPYRSQNDSNQTTRTSSPTVSEAPTILYRTPLQSEVRGTPLPNHIVSRDTVPYKTPEPKVATVTHGVQDYSNLPVVNAAPYGTRPISRVENPTVLYRTPMQSEVRGTPLPNHVTHKDTVPYRSATPDYSNFPVVHTAPYGTRAITPTVSHPSDFTYRTPLQSEVRGTPLPNHVSLRDTVPYRNATPDYSNFPVVHTAPYGTRPVSPTVSQPSEITYRTPLQSEVRGTPLPNHVTSRDTVPYRSATPDYRNFPVVQSEPYGTRPISPSIAQPSEITYRTPLQSEVRGTPLPNHVTHKDTVPYRSATPDYHTFPVIRSGPYGTRAITPNASQSPTIVYGTPLHSEVRGTPLPRYVVPKDTVPYSSKNPDYSSLPVVQSGPYGTHTVPPSPTKTPTITHSTPLPLYSDVRGTPLPHHVILRDTVPYRSHPREGTVSSPTVIHSLPKQSELSKTPFKPFNRRSVAPSPHVSELHAEKRMIVGIESQDQPDEDHVTYVKLEDFPTYSTTSSLTSSPLPRHLKSPDEPLHRAMEVSRYPIHAMPPQTSYEKLRTPIPSHPHHVHTKSVDKETQYSRRPSEDVCNVENCTHVEVRDTPVVPRRRISQDTNQNENRLTIHIDEKDEGIDENIVDLSRDEDVGPPTSQSRRCFEEKLFYNSYMPTLSLHRRPVVSFYDKLH